LHRGISETPVSSQFSCPYFVKNKKQCKGMAVNFNPFPEDAHQSLEVKRRASKR
jgi:hypothetical protein